MKAIETLKSLSVIVLALHALVLIGAGMLVVYLMMSEATMGVVFPLSIGAAAAYAAIPWLLVYVFADLAKNVMDTTAYSKHQSELGCTVANTLTTLNATSKSTEERQWDICDRLEGLLNELKAKETV